MVTNLRDKVQFFPGVVAGLVVVLPGTGNGNVGSALSPLSTSAVSAAQVAGDHHDPAWSRE